MPLRRQGAACANRAWRSASPRLAVLVAIVAAIGASAHAATPFEVHVAGSGPDVLLIPGLASSGAVWDDTVKQLCTRRRCHVFTLAGVAGVPAQPGPLLDKVDATLDRVAVIDAMREMPGHDLRPQLAAIRAPTLVMGSWVADKDTGTLEAARAVYERQHRTLPGVRIAMSPAGRHFILLDDPAWFEKTLEDFAG